MFDVFFLVLRSYSNTGNKSHHLIPNIHKSLVKYIDLFIFVSRLLLGREWITSHTGAFMMLSITIHP